MAKYKLKENVASVYACGRLIEDHKTELKESDFPKGRLKELLKNGHLVEVKEKKKTTEKK